MKNIQCGKQSKRGYVVMLCCCVGYVVMLFNLVSSNARYIFYPERGVSLIHFHLKGNNESKSVSKMIVQCRFQSIIPINSYKK